MASGEAVFDDHVERFNEGVRTGDFGPWRLSHEGHLITRVVVTFDPKGGPGRVGGRWPELSRYVVGVASKNAVQSAFCDWPFPRMNSSTISRAASSENCTGGDFMK